MVFGYGLQINRIGYGNSYQQPVIAEKKAENLRGAEKARYNLFYEAFEKKAPGAERDESIRCVLAGTYEMSELYEGQEERIRNIPGNELLAEIVKRLAEEIGHEMIESEIDLMAIRDILRIQNAR